MMLLDNGEERWCVVEHRGFGPNHRTCVICDRLTCAEAWGYISRQATRFGTKRRNLHAHAYRPDGVYDFNEADQYRI